MTGLAGALPGATVRRTVGAVLTAALVAFAVVVPNFLTAYSLYILTEIVIFAIACLGLTVVIGWSGQTALAQAGFFGVGAYGTAYLVSQGLPWFLGVVIAAVLAALIGVLIGIPATRLKGFYFAIATLAFGELMTQIFNEWTAVTGGPVGMPVDLLLLGSLSPNTSLWYMSAVILAITVLVLWHASRTRWGRCLRAVRDMEIATGSLGMSAMKYKVQAFAVSAILGSVAGSLFGQALTYINPSAFTSTLVIEFLIVILVGGADRIAGAIVGAAFLVLIQEQLQSVGAYQRLAFGAALVVMVRFLPQGIMPLLYSLARRVFSPERRPPESEPGRESPSTAAANR
jgi:branched-chain amino acid transport system permease protein